ncbi:MAG: hypothetical protein LBC68_15105 [Prevotellaceae bacterium]|nr:hypothetical protein [Prevotellaceae bacterium]
MLRLFTTKSKNLKTRQTATSCISCGLTTVFRVSDSAPREKELCTPSAGR